MKRYFLYDGNCGVCSWSVRFFLRFSKSDDFYFSSLYSEFTDKLLDHLVVVYDQDEEGAIYVRDEEVYHRSTAILQAMSDCLWPFSMAKIFLKLPERFRDWLYRGFAKNRLKVSKILNLKCGLPSKADSKRLL